MDQIEELKAKSRAAFHAQREKYEEVQQSVASARFSLDNAEASLDDAERAFRDAGVEEDLKLVAFRGEVEAHRESYRALKQSQESCLTQLKESRDNFLRAFREEP